MLSNKILNGLIVVIIIMILVIWFSPTYLLNAIHSPQLNESVCTPSSLYFACQNLTVQNNTLILTIGQSNDATLYNVTLLFLPSAAMNSSIIAEGMPTFNSLTSGQLVSVSFPIGLELGINITPNTPISGEIHMYYKNSPTNTTYKNLTIATLTVKR